MSTKSTTCRGAMTLVELLVVMVIILVLATIVVAFAPGFQDAQKVAHGADQLQMWLVSARQTAKSARVPSGLRLFINNGKVNEMQYIQQPSTFVVPYAVPAVPAGVGTTQPQFRRISIDTMSGSSVVTLDLNGIGPLQAGQVPGDFSGGQLAVGGDSSLWPVQKGDYLVIHGTPCAIPTVDPLPPKPPVFNATVTPSLCNQINLSIALPGNLQTVPPTTDYYFVRAARPLTGESTLKLPQDVAIDMTQSIPPQAPPGSGTFDIMFSPSGEVIAGSFSSPTLGTNSALNNKIVFWILDATKPAGNAQDTLIAVDTRTGMIAAQPVNVGGSDLYLYTKDGRTSGL